MKSKIEVPRMVETQKVLRHDKCRNYFSKLPLGASVRSLSKFYCIQLGYTSLLEHIPCVIYCNRWMVVVQWRSSAPKCGGGGGTNFFPEK